MSRPPRATDELVASSRPSIGELLRWVPRAGHPGPAVAALAAAPLLVVWKWGALASLDDRVWVVRAGTLVVVLGALYLLDDRGRRPTSTAVITLRRRIGARLLAVGMLTAAGFLALVALTGLQGAMGSVLGGLVVEVVGVALSGAAVTLLLQRSRDLDEPATAGAMTLLALVALVPLVGMRWPFLVSPGPEWEAAHMRWAVVTAAAALTLVWVTRDPATTLRGMVRAAVSRPVTAGAVSR